MAFQGRGWGGCTTAMSAVRSTKWLEQYVAILLDKSTVAAAIGEWGTPEQRADMRGKFQCVLDAPVSRFLLEW
jgi:hypothetical protein